VSTDAIALLAEQVRAAAQAHRRLVVRGSDSKSFLYERTDAAPLHATDVAGIVDYAPAELVVTARAGTPLSALRAAVAAEGQMLGCDPPSFGGEDAGTLGGAIAAGLAGPARPWRGAVRDAVLGVEIVNGLGTHLAFGGRVMKNVAGYDVSRLMAASHGTLGVIVAASVRVVPMPEAETTLRFELDRDTARARTTAWGRRPLPITATCHADRTLCVRLSGTATGVTAAIASLGGDAVPEPEASAFWSSVRDHRHPFFQGRALWRVSLPPAAPDPDLGADVAARWLTEWGGALRWLVSDADATRVRRAAAACGGFAQCFSSPGGFAPVTDVVERYQARLRAAFDPHGVFARGGHAAAA
jgi:glycolate oxidase FAD binding subunit